MKAIEFIKKFGWSEALELYKASLYKEPFKKEPDTICGVNKADLKRYVDAYELVQLHGGLSRVGNAIKGKHIGYTHFYLSGNGRYVFLDHYNDFIPDYACHIGMFNKAIALVEEVENFNG